MLSLHATVAISLAEHPGTADVRHAYANFGKEPRSVDVFSYVALQVYARYPQHRQPLLLDVFSTMMKLPAAVSKAAKNYRLQDSTGSIHTLSAAVLLLFQSGCAVGPEKVLLSLRR
jgi:hypothetical protein